MTDQSKEIIINVPVLARVEGEGALDLHIKDNKIERLNLKIFEPPRLFEKLLQGRNHQQVIDIVARICGICPVAYQMSAVDAIENAYQVSISEQVRLMRRMFMCGEWIESHALHIHLLALPDFYGCANAIELAQQYPEQVKRGVRIQALGNRLIKLFGGRSVHPVGVCVGSFHRTPTAQEFKSIANDLAAMLEQVVEMIHWLAQIKLPNDNDQTIAVSLRHPHEYAMNEGRIISSEGLDIGNHEYADYFEENQVDYSTAKHSLLNSEPYLVGPLARLNNNWQQLHTTQRELIKDIGLSLPSHNMFHSMLARGVEIHYAIEEASKIANQLYKQPDLTDTASDINDDISFTETVTGYGSCEAPRGLLWHQYQFDATGLVTKATIVPPTSQNQARMEQDIARSLSQYGLDNQDKDLKLHAEQVIRNYDPCISCATHFLSLKTIRE